MFCRSCGTELKDGAKFCNKCGTATIIKSSNKDDSVTVPTFSPPPPKITIPSEKMTGSIPVFTPPESSSTDSKTSGVPIFAPPKDSNVCYCHTNEAAVTKCTNCGRLICKDCADSYIITGDFEFSGKPLCYECANAVFQEDIEIHNANMHEIRTQFIITFIGMIIGGAIFASAGGLAGFLIGFLAGGCLGTFLWTFCVEFIRGFIALIGAVVSADESFIGAAFGAVFNMFIGAGKAILGTFTKLFKYTFYLLKIKHYKNIAETGLREITAYYEYTIIRSRNIGMDLSALMASGGELENNSFAQSVVTLGETQALENINQIRISYNEFGEIVRDFKAA